MFWNKTDPSVSFLSDLLKDPALKEDLLGTKAVAMPSPQKIQADASRLVRHSTTEEYRVFAQEAWARVLVHLDAMMDERNTQDRIQFHRGALKATLDLLRLSHQARATKDVLDNQAPLRPQR